MTRHPLDHDHKPAESTRTEQYARIEREGQAKDASKSLQRRPQEVQDGTRVKEFLDIERRAEG